MMKKAVIFTLTAFAAIVLADGLIYEFHRNDLAIFHAEKLMSAGDYAGAREIFEEIGEPERAEECESLKEAQIYTDAKILLQTGSYSEAREQLKQIPELDGTENLLRYCDFLEAEELTGKGEYSAAREIFLDIADFPGSDRALDALNILLYERAQELAYNFDLQGACDIWRELWDYKKSEVLLKRGERITKWLASGEKDSVMNELEYWSSGNYVSVYACDLGYLVIPKECNKDTGFVLYYPGGRNEDLYIDYLLCYLQNPAKNAITLFLRRNGLNDMESKNEEALDLLEHVAAEKGLFVHDLVVCGSSLGAYPALHSAVYSYRDRGIYVPCVLSLDAGGDWVERTITLNDDECAEAAALGTEFFLFESIEVGMNREAIVQMVNAGIKVTIVGCVYDDHTRITMDALGMGAVEWALGDRTTEHRTDIYSYTRPEPTA